MQLVRLAQLDLRVQPVRQVQLAPRVRLDRVERLEQLVRLVRLDQRDQLDQQDLRVQLVRVVQPLLASE